MTGRLNVAVTIDCAAWRDAVADADALCRRAAVAALEGAAEAGTALQRPAEVSVLLADDRQMQDLNRSFRGRDAPTDVLSFPAEDTALATTQGRPSLLGDIAIGFQTAAGDARQSNRPLADHLCHLVVHGMLHLLGFDHLDDADAERMERLEVRILAGMDVANPYHQCEPAR